MKKRIHRDLYGTGGKDKFHIDELANDLMISRYGELATRAYQGTSWTPWKIIT